MFNHTNTDLSLQTVIIRASEYKYSTNNIDNTAISETIHIKWMTPPFGFFRLDIDGAFKNRIDAAIAGVIRNYNGDYVVGYYQTLCVISDTQAHQMVLQHGLYLAISQNFAHVETKTNFIEVSQLFDQIILFIRLKLIFVGPY